MNNIEVEISAQELSNSDTTFECTKLIELNFDTDATITQDEANTPSEPVFREEGYSNDEEETHFEKVGQTVQNASLVEPPLDGCLSTSTVSSESSNSTPEEIEGALTQEERLIDRVAEFEGKVEALRSLKESLYSAIEQLEFQTQQQEVAQEEPEGSASTQQTKEEQEQQPESEEA